MSERLSFRTQPAGFLLVVLILCAGPSFSFGGTALQGYEIAVPTLDPSFSPLAVENRPLLYDRLIADFTIDSIDHRTRSQDRKLSDGMTIYYVQRELQAFIDLWRATGYDAYLDQATSLALQAINEATANPRPLIWHEQWRGDWPCFYLDTVEAETGGHNQLCDFQGSAGFLSVARVLHQINRPEWSTIADFVERDIVEKWLYYKPSVTEAHLTGPRTNEYLLAILNSGRDAREHFACICLDLHRLGYSSYPYWDWANLLVDLYLTPRYDVNDPAPHQTELPGRIPADWGLFVHTERDGSVWYSVPNYDPNSTSDVMDTSHANRTIWLGTRACCEGMIPKSTVLSLANTLLYRIWAPEKGPFYFTNYVDGSDGELGGLTGGRAGNLWFGWHRLAAFDESLEDLFVSMAYDLTNGGPNLPSGAQNKTMPEAPLCLKAWAARLLSTKGQPFRFP